MKADFAASCQLLPPRNPQTDYRLNPLGNSICDEAATKSPRKVLRSSLWAHHFHNRNSGGSAAILYFFSSAPGITPFKGFANSFCNSGCDSGFLGSIWSRIAAL